MAADYKTPQWLLPNELNMSLNPALSESRHSLYSMDFDGTDDFIQVGQTTDAIIDFSKPWSVSWWAKWTYSPGFDCFWQFGSTASPVRYVLAWAHSTGIGYTISNSASLGISYNIANGLNDGNWHNIVFTGNGNTSGAGIMNVYVDGVLNTDTPTGTGVGSSTVAMNNIGRGHQTTGRNFNGSIDELAIWNKELNQSEINALSVASAPANLMALPTKPAAYYPLGEQAQMGYSNWNFPNGSLQSHVVDFDGTVGEIALTSPFVAAGEFTLSLWINPDNVVDNNFLGNGGAGSNWLQIKTASQIKIRIASSAAIAFTESGGNDLTASAWNHILIYRDSSNNVGAYVNGQTFGSAGSNTSTLTLSTIGRATGIFFEGDISNVAFWTSDQSANITNIYNNGSPQSTYTVTPNNWWKLNAADSSYNTATSTWTFTDGPGTNDGTSTTLPSTALTPSDLQFESPYSNYSLSFDGVDDYVDTNYIFPTISNWSVSFWANIVDPSNSNYYYYITARNSSTTGLIVWSGDGSASSQRNFSAKINSTTITFSVASFATWYNIVITGDGSNLTAYVDGVQVATTAISTLFPTLTYTTKIGSNKDGTNYFLNAKIDETAIWNSALTQAQISQVYNNGYPADLTSLSPSQWWRLGEDAFFVSNVVTIPNKITGGPSGTGGGGDQSAFLVGEAPGSYANGLGSSLDVSDRTGDAPESTANSVSINMIPSNRHSYPAGYTPTQVNNAFSMAFDGVDDYFEVPSFTTSGNDVTISFWLKAVNLSGSSPYTTSAFLYCNASNYVYYNVNEVIYSSINGSVSLLVANSGGVPQIFGTGNWHHLAIVKSGSTVTWYVDGNSFSDLGSGGTGGFTFKYIGAAASISNYYLNGSMDEVAIFDYALTSKQIKQDIYEGTTTGKTADLNNISNLTPPVAWYRMGD